LKIKTVLFRKLNDSPKQMIKKPFSCFQKYN
jgi:hypothetical protein